MKAIIHDFSTNIFPTDDEVKEHCRPGAGADTCSWLTMSPKGWECVCLDKPGYLMDRRDKGQMTAMRDGCDKVNAFNPGAYDEESEVEF